MNKTLLNGAIVALLGTASMSANALSAGDTLSITSGTELSCLLGTTPPCANPLFEVVTQVGSFFNLGGDVYLTGNEGIVLGSTQLASGSHSGAINGSESPSIDLAWEFSGNTGMHQSTSDINILSDDGAGNFELDFTGWSVTWNGVPNIPMGGDSANFAADTGIATLSCSSAACTNGDTYTLDYAAHVPLDFPGFGGAAYTLHLEGVVSAVPVPAAVWLFGSGLIGLAGVARRKKATVA